MTELKVEGLGTQDDIWRDFGTEEGLPRLQQKAETQELEAETQELARHSPKATEEDKDESHISNSMNPEETTVIIENSNNHQTEAENEDKDCKQLQSEQRSDSSTKSKARKSKASKHRQHSPGPTRLPHKRREVSQSHSSNRHEQERARNQGHRSHEVHSAEQHGRRLNRRRQMKNQYLLEQVDKAGQERLEQKLLELEDLLTRPLADTRVGGHHMSTQSVQRMVHLHHSHGQNGYPDEPEGDSGREERQAYSTIRVLQTSGRNIQLKITYSPRDTLPQPGLRPPEKSSVSHHSSQGSVDSPTTSSSGQSHSRMEQKENGYDSYSSNESDSSDSEDNPHRALKPMDTFLRHTDNPKLREWIRRKDVEYRKARKAERIKRREERNDKMVEDELKIARRAKSSEHVKQWMAEKRKEIIMQQKVERRRRKQEKEEERSRRARSQDSCLQGTCINRPQTAPTQKSGYRLIKRPNSAAAKLDEGQGLNSRPQDTKFVYKRSVTGRVQLMKLQNERNVRARSADEQRCNELSADEMQEKARTSYDAWLLAKKKESLENKRVARRQKESMKIDPDLERIIPELARRRIDRVKNGKRTLDTGHNRCSITKSGAEEVETQEGEGQVMAAEPPVEELTISGVAATMTTTDNRRPASAARVRTPKPHKSSSPPRPKSAAIPGRSSRKTTNPEPLQAVRSWQFKLPFPEELGVPYHVMQMQEKLFAPHLTASQSEDRQRPEPQGCASVEAASCPKGRDRASPRTSLVLLQEIEAEVLQSEQSAEERATLIVVQKALKKTAGANKNDDAGGDSVAAGNDQDAEEVQEYPEQCLEKPGEEPSQPDAAKADAEDKAERDVQREEKPEYFNDVPGSSEYSVEELELFSEEESIVDNAEKNDDELNQENGEGNDSQPQQVEDESVAANDGTDQPQDEEPAENLEEEAEGEEVAEEIEGEENVEDFSEEADRYMKTDPTSVIEDEALWVEENEGKGKPVEPAAQEESEGAKEEVEEYFNQPDLSDPTSCLEEGVEQDTNQTAGLDDESSILRKSEKRVSFSEELATVFEPTPLDISTSFEDEQSDEIKEQAVQETMMHFFE